MMISLLRSSLKPYSLALLPMLVLLSSSALLPAQTTSSHLSMLHERIRNEVTALNALDTAKASTVQAAYSWATLGSDYAAAAEFSNAENAFNHALQLLRHDDSARPFYAAVLEKFGYLYLTFGHFDEALNLRRAALTVREQIGSPIEIARGRSHLAEVLLATHHYKQAEFEADAAYQAMRQHDDPEKADLVSALVVRAYARCGHHNCDQGLIDAQEAEAMSRASFQPDSLSMGAALAALGYAQQHSGAIADAEETSQRALVILKELLAPGDPRLIHALVQYHDCLEAQHKKPEAREIDNQLSVMYRQSRQSCLNCSISAFGMRSTAP